MNSDGTPCSFRTTAKPLFLTVEQSIPAGSWKTFEAQLDGPTEGSVGFFYLDSISVSQIKLSAE
jgi:hypothetical protein